MNQSSLSRRQLLALLGSAAGSLAFNPRLSVGAQNPVPLNTHPNMNPDITKPNAGQRAMIERGYGMFIHFGINTFNQTEWSDGTLLVSSYNPTELDCDQWIRVAKEAGFRHIVLVTKHHDGFCLWPTKSTDYCVSSSPVKTDVVGEVAKACQKYGVKLGLYYSLWDRHEPTHELPDTSQYVEYMKGHLTELLTNYGDVCELWFDGGWVKTNEEWNMPALYAHIKALQSECQVTVNITVADPDKVNPFQPPRYYQQGDPLRFWPVDFRSKDPNIARWDDPKLYTTPDGQLVYLPFEQTICLSERWNWFQKRDIMPTRSLDELEELFYWGTKDDQVLIINLPPDQAGRLRENEIEAILALADRLDIRGGNKPLPMAPINQAFNVPTEATSIWTADPGYGPEKAVDTDLESRWAAKDNSADLTLSPEKPFVFDRVTIHEYPDTRGMGDGFSQERVFRVQEYVLEALQNGEWKTIDTGTSLGAAKIILWPEKVTAQKLRLRITKASAPPSIYHISVCQRTSQKRR